MRWTFACFVFSCSLALTSCSSPPPPPKLASAASGSGLRIRISAEYVSLGNGYDEVRDANYAAARSAAQRALVTRLGEAGYRPIESGSYDLSVGSWYAMRWERGEDPAFAKARIRLKDRKGRLVDDITLEFRGQTAPISEPDRVAISLVNHLTRSPKVAKFAAVHSPPTTEPCIASDEGEPLP